MTPKEQKQYEMIREKIAQLCYQYAYLVDDKCLERQWITEKKKERWFDCVDQILAIIKLALPELAKDGGYVKLVDIIKDVERSSHPMNTNMYGISLSSVSWEAIKSKYLKQASLNQI